MTKWHISLTVATVSLSKTVYQNKISLGMNTEVRWIQTRNEQVSESCKHFSVTKVILKTCIGIISADKLKLIYI